MEGFGKYEKRKSKTVTAKAALHNLELEFLGFDAAFEAESCDFALGTVGLSCGAAFAPVPDQKMGKEGPIFLGHQFHQSRFDLNGILLAGESHAS